MHINANFIKENTMKKRFLLLSLICLILVFAAVACSDKTTEQEEKKTTEEVNGFVLTLSNDGKFYTITEVKNKANASYSIPTSHNNLPITTIGENAFYGCSSMREINIPNGITSIGKNAFAYCSSLYRVTLASSVNSIGADAFSGCSKLVEICNFSKLNLIAGQNDNGSIAKYALNICTSEQGKKISFVDGFVFFDNGSTPYLIGYEGNNTEIELPENFNGKSYTIYDYAFAKSSITFITIPGSVTLGKGAFYNSALVSARFLDGIVEISDNAFECCSQLKSIALPDTVTYVGKRAFAQCEKLESIILSNQLTSIEDETFDSCFKLSGVVLPEGITAIGKRAFYGCASITSVISTKDTDKINSVDVPFAGLAIPDSVQKIGDSAFSSCSSLSSFYCPSEVISIGNDAFAYCGVLATFSVNATSKSTYKLQSIGDRAFYNCSKLNGIYIPETVTYVGENAFFSCVSIIIKTQYKEIPSTWNENFNPHGFTIETNV